MLLKSRLHRETFNYESNEVCYFLRMDRIIHDIYGFVFKMQYQGFVVVFTDMQPPNLASQ